MIDPDRQVERGINRINALITGYYTVTVLLELKLIKDKTMRNAKLRLEKNIDRIYTEVLTPQWKR